MTSVTRDGSVEFSFYRKGATRVQVVGDFADPDARGDALEMFGGDDGWWRATARLACGEYRFHYVADGERFPDYASHGVEMSEAGVNSVLIVPARRLPTHGTPRTRMVA
jgi:1,4-alpha-glucan branching enzyme